MAAFGIYYGTCSACLAVYKDGFPTVVANDLGDRVTPCVVAFTDQDVIVGMAAKQRVIRNSMNTVSHVKRILGLPLDSVVLKDFMALSSTKVVTKEEQMMFKVCSKEKHHEFYPADIVGMIFKKVLESARHCAAGCEVPRVVLAVPFDFNERQRDIIRSAATKAGFSVLRLVNECSAAAFAYDLGQREDRAETFKVLVYRMGGTSHDAAVLHIQNGVYRVLGSRVDRLFGGDQFSKLLQKYLLGEFHRLHRLNVDGNERSSAKLWLGAEECKHLLSRMENAQCSIDSLMDGVDFDINISRPRFETQCSALVGRCVRLIEETLLEAGSTKKDISKVVVCGGGTFMPMVQRSISSLLPDSQLLNVHPVDEVIAIGAAKQAGLLAGRDVVELELSVGNNCLHCLAADIYILADDGKDVVFGAGSMCPSRHNRTVQLTVDQTSFLLVICEATDRSECTPDVKIIAKIVMRDLPAGSSVNVTFHLKREGELHIHCTEPSSHQHQVTCVPVGDLSNSREGGCHSDCLSASVSQLSMNHIPVYDDVDDVAGDS